MDALVVDIILSSLSSPVMFNIYPPHVQGSTSSQYHVFPVSVTILYYQCYCHVAVLLPMPVMVLLSCCQCLYPCCNGVAVLLPMPVSML